MKDKGNIQMSYDRTTARQDNNCQSSMILQNGEELI